MMMPLGMCPCLNASLCIVFWYTIVVRAGLIGLIVFIQIIGLVFGSVLPSEFWLSSPSLSLSSCALWGAIEVRSAILSTYCFNCVYSDSKVGLGIGLAIGIGVPIIIAIILVVCILMHNRSKNCISSFVSNDVMLVLCISFIGSLSPLCFFS